MRAAMACSVAAAREAADYRQLSRVVSCYGRLDLLLLDELGYVQVDPRAAELLFQIITRTRGTLLDRHRVKPAVQVNGAPSYPTPAWSPRSSTGSPSTPTSSRPAPTATGSAPPRTAVAASPPDQRTRCSQVSIFTCLSRPLG
jgi:hypothetical protein